VSTAVLVTSSRLQRSSKPKECSFCGALSLHYILHTTHRIVIDNAMRRGAAKSLKEGNHVVSKLVEHGGRDKAKLYGLSGY
jgi:hypothetical protein